MTYLLPVDPKTIAYDLSSYVADSARGIYFYDKDYNVVSSIYSSGGSEQPPVFIELHNETFESYVQ